VHSPSYYRESVAYRSFDEEPILPEVSEKLPQGWNIVMRENLNAGSPRELERVVRSSSRE
jgi:hypothetical protein